MFQWVSVPCGRGGKLAIFMRQIFSVLSCSVGVCKDRTNLDSFLNVYYCAKLSYLKIFNNRKVMNRTRRKQNYCWAKMFMISSHCDVTNTHIWVTVTPGVNIWRWILYISTFNLFNPELMDFIHKMLMSSYHGNIIGIETLFQIDQNTFIRRKRTN